MMFEHTQVGDAVAVYGSRYEGGIFKAEVRAISAREIRVGERRYNRRNGRLIGRSAYDTARIEPWTERHVREWATAQRKGRLRALAQATQTKAFMDLPDEAVDRVVALFLELGLITKGD